MSAKYLLLIHPNGGTPKYWAKSEATGHSVFGSTIGLIWNRTDCTSSSTASSKLAKGYKDFGSVDIGVLDTLTGRGRPSNEDLKVLELMEIRVRQEGMPSLAFQIEQIRLARIRASPQGMPQSRKADPAPLLLPTTCFDPLTDW